jgi:nitrate/TMAO reductase-like tetraheme cytochrome c subunit
LSPGEHGYQPRPPKRYRSTWIVLIIVVACVVVVGVIVAIPVWATSTPTYCMSCKATRAAGQEWKTSTHSKVSCVACHFPPGFASSLKWRGREALNIWADYLNVPRTATKGQVPGNASCLKCHSLNGIPNQSGDIRMPHAVHVAQRNLTCADCHDKIAHHKPGEVKGVSMQVCSMCHQAQIAADECTFCHITPPPKNVHPKNYLTTHGPIALQDEASCLRCHHSKEQFCNPCHAQPTADHFSGTWRYAHGPAAKNPKAQCLGCHDKETFCNQCHEVDHPSDWLKTHADAAAKSPGACLVCHPRALCDRCHQQRGVRL